MADVWELGKRYAALRERLYSQNNIVPVSISGHPAGTLVSNKPILHVEDLKGKKIGCDGSVAALFNSFGATAVTLEAGDMYSSLSPGLVDAVEFSSIIGAYEMGLHEVGKYFVDMRAYPMCPMLYMANKTFWDSLSPSDRALLTYAAGYVSSLLRYENDYKLQKTIAVLGQKGIVIQTWGDTDVRKWMDRNRELRPAHPENQDWVEAWKIMDAYMKEVGY
jgi:TRAP-type C4-dicarboxylate transport system substrate-binding protein